MKKVFVTGVAGFIGYHFAQHLLSKGYAVYGLDDMNDYYDVRLKQHRLQNLQVHKNFHFEPIDMAEKPALELFYENSACEYVVHLAAQPGVRYSLEKPEKYVSSNIVGTANLLECCRKAIPKHFIYASSSSVYGDSQKFPLSEDDDTDHPISFYAATKKSNEVMAESYAHLYRIPTTGLRFFTVYGPWGRPDMALFKFTKSILEEKPIEMFNGGELYRDFTYVNDIVQGLFSVLGKKEIHQTIHEIYNIGRGEPVKVTDFVQALEGEIGKRAIIIKGEMQKGDVHKTFADTTKLKAYTGYQPRVSITEGIQAFFEWYRNFYKV